MDVIPYLVNRSKNFIDLLIKNNPQYSKYRIRAASNVDDAYGSAEDVMGAGTSILFEVFANQTFQSPSIAKKKYYYSENTKEQTRAIFDLDDYALPTNQIPRDSNLCFLRVEPFSVVANAYLPEGPIFVIPTPNYYAVTNPILPFTARSPSIASVAGDLPTPEALHIVMPSFSKSVTIINGSAVNSIFVSFGKGIPYIEIPPDVKPSIHNGSVDELFVVSGIGNTATPFTITFETFNF